MMLLFRFTVSFSYFEWNNLKKEMIVTVEFDFLFSNYVYGE